MTNGGSQAAKLLKDAIGQYLRRIGLDKHICRIDVRVYANLNSLSKDVLKERSAQSRALAPFAAGFSREEVFFDFVDVGDENIVKAKIAGKYLVTQLICSRLTDLQICSNYTPETCDASKSCSVHAAVENTCLRFKHTRCATTK